MSWRHLLHIVGAVVAAIGASMLVPTVTSLAYGEWGVALQIVMAGVVTVAVGGTLWRIFDQPGELSTRVPPTVATLWLCRRPPLTSNMRPLDCGDTAPACDFDSRLTAFVPSSPMWLCGTQTAGAEQELRTSADFAVLHYFR